MDKVWKSAERHIAKLFGGKRRGADFRGESSGKSDIIKEGWSIEVKHNQRPTYGLMVDAVEQARINRPKEDDIPVAVIHKAGTNYDKSLVIMRLDDFLQYFCNQS